MGHATFFQTFMDSILGTHTLYQLNKNIYQVDVTILKIRRDRLIYVLESLISFTFLKDSFTFLKELVIRRL